MFGSIVVGGGLYLLGRLLGGERRRILGMLCRVSALCVSEYLGVLDVVMVKVGVGGNLQWSGQVSGATRRSGNVCFFQSNSLFI